jgi:hypothetical protein
MDKELYGVYKLHFVLHDVDVDVAVDGDDLAAFNSTTF